MRPTAPRRAFSLLEVLLALAIFATAVIGITEGIVVQIRSERMAEDTTRAVVLAQNIIEEIRYGGDYAEDQQSGEFDGENAGIRWEYEITKTDIESLFRVKVTLKWTDGLAPKQYVTETLMAERTDEGRPGS